MSTMGRTIGRASTLVLAACAAAALPAVARAGVVKVLPSEMVARVSATNYTVTPAYLFNNDAEIRAFTRLVRLPAGAVITRVALFFRGEGADRIWCYLRRSTMAAGSQDANYEMIASADGISDASGDVVERALDFEPGASRRVVAGDTYYLYLQLEGAATFIGAKVLFR